MHPPVKKTAAAAHTAFIVLIPFIIASISHDIQDRQKKGQEEKQHNYHLEPITIEGRTLLEGDNHHRTKQANQRYDNRCHDGYVLHVSKVHPAGSSPTLLVPIVFRIFWCRENPQ